MTTFKTFTTVDEVFDALVGRFNIKPLVGLTPKQLHKWEKVKKTPVRLR
jgi:son of sevenless-like protein